MGKKTKNLRKAAAKAMPEIDVERALIAAIEAAFDHDHEKPRRRFGGVRAVAAGAALAVAARAAVSRAPSLPHLPDLGSIPDRLRDNLVDRGWLEEDEEEEPLDEVDKDEDPA